MAQDSMEIEFFSVVGDRKKQVAVIQEIYFAASCVDDGMSVDVQTMNICAAQ